MSIKRIAPKRDEAPETTQPGNSQQFLSPPTIFRPPLPYRRIIATMTTTNEKDPNDETAVCCHMLPCDVEFEGMAKTHVFFKPLHIENGVFASSVRGRGLLAHSGSSASGIQQQDRCTYSLLSLEENKTIRVKESIGNMMEWHHEHSIQSMKLNGGSGGDDPSSRLQIAREWMELSQAMHEPLQLDE